MIKVLGDFHTHTTYSSGFKKQGTHAIGSIEDNTRVAYEKGLSTLVISVIFFLIWIVRNLHKFFESHLFFHYSIIQSCRFLTNMFHYKCFYIFSNYFPSANIIFTAF